ncbi:MAG: Bug family tripartite tricarboxylate transporter substrate binding protein [Hypericibacter sp.]
MIARHGFALTALAIVAGLSVPKIEAADFPTRPIRVVVAFTPGGGLDTVARMLQPAMVKSLGQPVIIENRPGASGAIAAGVVMKATPDGHTLFFASAADMVYGPLQNDAAGYDARKDFKAITQTHRVPYLIVVHSSSPLRTIQELIALAKKEPGKLTYGSWGVGSSNRMGMELFARETGTKFYQIPYSGSAQTIVELLARRTDFGVESPGASRVHRESGALRPLVIAEPVRMPALPDIPTMVESGYPRVLFYSYGGFLAPAGTPDAVIDRLQRVIRNAVNSVEISAFLNNNSWVPVASSPKEFGEFIKAEMILWTKLIADVKRADAAVGGR